MGWRRPRGIWGGNIHLLVFLQRIRRIDHDTIGEIDPLENFQGISKIPPDRQLFKLDSVIGANNSGHRPIWPEKERVHW